MPRLADLISASDVAEAVDPGTYARGLGYLHDGRVAAVQVARNASGAVVESTVTGSGLRTYQVVASVRRLASGPELFLSCSCPIGQGCKHAVAMLLAALGDDHGGAAPTSSPVWQQRLDELLDGVAQPTRTGPSTPLALEVRHDPPRVSAARWREWTGTPRPVTRRLTIRPLTRGRSGRWVRSALGWSDLARVDVGSPGAYDQRQLDALRDLATAQRSGELPGLGDRVDRDLMTAGPSLWRCLDTLAETGVDLVAAGDVSDVRLETSPVELGLDVGRSGDAVRAEVGADVDGAWVPADRLTLIGYPAHGVAVWTPAPPGRPRPAGDVGDGPWTVVLAPLVRRATPAVQRMVEDAAALEVPPDDLDHLVDGYLPRLRSMLPAGSRDGTVDLAEPPAARLRVTIAWTGLDAEVAVDWRYPGRHGDHTYPVDSVPDPTSARDPLAEQQLLDRLRLPDEVVAALCTETLAGRPRLEGRRRFRGLDAADLQTVVVPLLPVGDDLELVVLGEVPDFRDATAAPDVTFASRGDALPDGRNDWLDLEVLVTVEGYAIGLPALIEALTRGDERLLVADGLVVQLDHPQLDRLARLVAEAAALGDQPDDGLRMSRYDADHWNELVEIGLVDAQAARWSAAARAMLDADDLPEVAVPSRVHADLRPYQRAGLTWLAHLYESRLGGVLADDMGLGKTLQTLALVAYTRAETDRPFLVVAPTSVVGAWAGEAARFVPDLTVRCVTEGRSRRGVPLARIAAGADVVVTSYTLFRLEHEAYADVAWAGLVLDEAQAVKNYKGKTYQAVRRVEAPFRLAITGTPMENNLMELWSLLSIVAPGLYPHPGRFSTSVALPIERGNDAEALDRLRRRIRPLILRRAKELVAADLPPKQEQVLEVELGARHRKIYDTHLQRERQHVLGLVGDLDQHRMAIFRSLTRLRQLSLDPALVDPAYDAVGSAKLDVLVEHLRELVAEGHRALVFSQFTSFLTRARARLDAAGLGYAYLDGSTTDRPSVVRGFREGGDPIFLISLKAGGTGLTLTEADYVFVLDPWWNPAVEDQAVDRAHRIGQTRHVNVYRLVAAGTIEQKVMELKERKAALTASVLDGGDLTTGRLTSDDIAALVAD